jgi:hypothetical protein
MLASGVRSRKVVLAASGRTQLESGNVDVKRLK